MCKEQKLKVGHKCYGLSVTTVYPQYSGTKGKEKGMGNRTDISDG